MRAVAYVSGHCGTGNHDRCLGVYAGTPCTCEHHTAPPEPVVVAVNCFFGCGHAVWAEDAYQAHEDMEQHYRVEHWADIRRAVGWAS